MIAAGEKNDYGTCQLHLKFPYFEDISALFWAYSRGRTDVFQHRWYI